MHVDDTPKIEFVPKTPKERAAFIREAEARMEVEEREELTGREALETLELPLRSPVAYPELAIDRHMVPMRDGARLRTHVYRPAAPGQFPVLIQRSPYDALSTLDMAPAMYREFARRGYCVVAQDVRGRFGSEGRFVSGDNELADTFDAIEWASKQPWSTGHVGMTGVSYQGTVSYQGAIGQHPALKAIMPVSVDYALHNVPFRVPSFGALGGWLIFAGQEGSETENPELIDYEHLPLTEIDNEAGFHSDAFDVYVSENYALFPTVSPEQRDEDLAKIGIPTLVVAGWYDQFNEAALENFSRHARLHPATTTLLVGPWHHDLTTQHGLDSIGEVPTPSAHLDEYWQAMERFFGQHLKGEDSALSDTAGPVRLYNMGANEWRHEQEWPPARARHTPLYLASDGTTAGGLLSWSPPSAAEEPDRYDYNPLNPIRPNKGWKVWEVVDDMGSRAAIQSRDDVLTYSSSVLEAAVEVTGVPTATLFAASSAPDTDFVVTLSDVYPDGHVQYLTHGIVRVTYRDGFEERKLIEPGTVYEYTFELWPTSNTFLKGHRIRVDITSSDMDRYPRNQNVASPPGRTADVAIARQTIHHSDPHLSRVELPIVEA